MVWGNIHAVLGKGTFCPASLSFYLQLIWERGKWGIHSGTYVSIGFSVSFMLPFDIVPLKICAEVFGQMEVKHILQFESFCCFKDLKRTIQALFSVKTERGGLR